MGAGSFVATPSRIGGPYANLAITGQAATLFTPAGDTVWSSYIVGAQAVAASANGCARGTRTPWIMRCQRIQTLAATMRPPDDPVLLVSTCSERMQHADALVPRPHLRVPTPTPRQRLSLLWRRRAFVYVAQPYERYNDYEYPWAPTDYGQVAAVRLGDGETAPGPAASPAGVPVGYSIVPGPAYGAGVNLVVADGGHLYVGAYLSGPTFPILLSGRHWMHTMARLGTSMPA